MLMLAGCASPEERRWAKGYSPVIDRLPAPPTASEFEWRKPSVALYSFPTLASGNPPASLKDLSDQGQAAFIETMTATGAKPEDIRDALARPIAQKAAQSEGTAAVEGSYKQTLVATVSRGWDAGPADRLVRTWIEVTPLNFVFDGYTVIATDNQLLNIAQITNTSTASLQAQLGRTTSDTTATTTTAPPVTSVLTDVLGTSAGVTGNLSNQRVTNATINQQYMKLGADILPTELRILRESERNLDISGNTLIALTMRIDPRRWRRDLPPSPLQLEERSQRVTRLRLASDSGVLQSPGDITLEVTLQKSPPSCPLIADVHLYYELRQVTGNPSTYVEGKQKADYKRGVYKKERVELVPATTVRRPSWHLYGRSDAELTLRDVFGQNLPLDFTSYEQARNFADWLNRNASAIKSSGLNLGQAGLRLYSGDEGTPFPAGPYEARPYEQQSLVELCRRIEHEPRIETRKPE
ncbi:hypothetical protein [Sphingomonas sp. BK481]|uniref:hypothetical protein n=1 Tax=Sphingomonas sp. BK481 TaxID=2586981 RepID=UPI00161B5124|nr:hypothetical protein [Sphingomonas sp. BK481]MBB3589358.1 hypothetical protein [Sphingomonas sp. BK481]